MAEAQEIIKKEMLVSIIIPVYNSSKTLFRCIESVVVSVEKITNDYEIICINDGSVDDSLQKLKEIASDNEKIIIIHQENAGAAAARNQGLKIAKGEFIAFNDSDDEWLENHFHLLLKSFKDNPELICIAGNHDIEIQNIPPLKKLNCGVYKIELKNEIFKNYFSPQSTMFKKECLVAGIYFKDGMRYAEEGYFFYKIVHSFSCGFINTQVSRSILCKARFGDSGLSGNLKAMEQGELSNLKYAYRELGIPFYLYLLAIVFSYIKYIRRIIISKLRKK